MEKEEKTFVEKFTYSWESLPKKIFHFIKEYFWFLMIGAILCYIDLRLAVFYIFFMLMFLSILADDAEKFWGEVDRNFLREINSKLDIIAHKIGVNRKDTDNYFMTKTKEGKYTKESKERLGRDMDELNETLDEMNEDISWDEYHKMTDKYYK